jgi:hypothetical protein
MVSFCFWDGDVRQFAGSPVKGRDAVTGVVDSFIPTPAEEPALVTKNETSQFAPLRAGFQRIDILCGTRSTASACYRSPVGARLNIRYIDVKNTLLLKLRI